MTSQRQAGEKIDPKELDGIVNDLFAKGRASQEGANHVANQLRTGRP